MSWQGHGAGRLANSRCPRASREGTHLAVEMRGFGVRDEELRPGRHRVDDGQQSALALFPVQRSIRSTAQTRRTYLFVSGPEFAIATIPLLLNCAGGQSEQVGARVSTVCLSMLTGTVRV